VAFFGDDRGTGDNITGTQRFAQAQVHRTCAVGENSAAAGATFRARCEFRRLVCDRHDADRSTATA
jgi:hypothetical protein